MSKYVDVHTDEIIKDMKGWYEKRLEMIKESYENLSKCYNKFMEKVKELKDFEIDEEDAKEKTETISENEGQYMYLYGEPDGITSTMRSLCSKGIKGAFKEGEKVVCIPIYALNEVPSDDFNKLLKSYEDREWIYGITIGNKEMEVNI